MQNEEAVVSVVTFNVTAENFSTVSRAAGLTLERRLPSMPGFISGTLLRNEGQSRIIAVTEWKSRHSWAAAHWDDEIERALVDLFEATASFHLEFFFPLVKVTSPGP